MEPALGAIHFGCRACGDALLLIGNFMIHIYMGVFAERGAFDSVISGDVSLAFAKRYHPGCIKRSSGLPTARNDHSVGRESELPRADRARRSPGRAACICPGNSLLLRRNRKISAGILRIPSQALGQEASCAANGDLRSELNLASAADSFAEFLKILEAHAPKALVEEARNLKSKGAGRQAEILQEFWKTGLLETHLPVARPLEPPLPNPFEDFFARLCCSHMRTSSQVQCCRPRR